MHLTIALLASLGIISQPVNPADKPAPASPAGKPAESAAESLFVGKPEVICEGFRFTEGPVWHDGALVFSDLSGGSIHRWTAKDGAKLLREKVSGACGNAIDRDGNVVTCFFSGKLERASLKDGVLGEPVLLADKFGTKRLNSPNDVVIKSDGVIYFTDPDFGVRGGRKPEVGFCGVYLMKADGKDVTVLAKDCTRPNGLAFSPDEKKMFVGDSSTNKIWVYEVKADGTLETGKVFAEMKREQGAPSGGMADGLKVDHAGRVFSTGPGGIWVFSPEGTKLEVYPASGASNFCFGGEEGKTMFITAGGKVMKVGTTTQGGKRDGAGK